MLAHTMPHLSCTVGISHVCFPSASVEFSATTLLFTSPHWAIFLSPKHSCATYDNYTGAHQHPLEEF